MTTFLLYMVAFLLVLVAAGIVADFLLAGFLEDPERRDARERNRPGRRW